MEQIQYQSFFEEQGYDPDQAPDFSAGIQNQFQAYIESLGQQSDQMRANAEINLRNLQNYNKDTIKFLSETSKTAADFLKNRAIKEAESVKADAAAQAEQDYLEGRTQSPEFRAKFQQLKDEDTVATAAADVVQGSDSTRQNAVFPLYSNTAWKQAMYTRAMARKLINTELGTYISKRIDEENPQTSPDRARVVAKAKAEFYQQTGLSNLNPDFMQDLYPDINSVTSKINAKYEVATAENNAEMQREKDLAILEESKDLTSFINGTSVSIKGGAVIGKGGAWNYFTENAPMWLFSGKISSGTYNQIKNQVIPEGAPGAGKTYGEFYKDRFAKIESKLFDLRKKKEQDDDFVEAQELEQLDKDLYEQAQANLGTLTQDDLDQLQKRYMQKSGGKRSARLDSLKEETVTAKDLEAQKEDAEQRLASGTLTLAYARTLDPSIREKYMVAAERQERLRRETDNFKDSEKAIKTRLSQDSSISVTFTGDAFTDYTVERYYQDKLRELRSVAEQIAAANPGLSAEQVRVQAEQIVLGRIAEDLKSKDPKFLDRNATDGVFPQYRVTGAQAKYEKQLEKLQVYRQVIAKGGEAKKKAILEDPAEKTFTKQELEALQGNSLNLQINPKMRVIASALKMDPVDLVLALRKKFGLTPYPAEDKRQEIRNGLSPGITSFLERYRTPESSLRAVYSFNRNGEYNDYLIPSSDVAGAIRGYAPFNIPETTLAGVVETIGFDKATTPEEVALIVAELNEILINVNNNLPAALDELGRRRNIPNFRQKAMRNAAKYGGELPTRGAFTVEPY